MTHLVRKVDGLYTQAKERSITDAWHIDVPGFPFPAYNILKPMSTGPDRVSVATFIATNRMTRQHKKNEVCWWG
jgi:hypothetical protein